MSNVVVYYGAKKWKVSLLGSAAVFLFGEEESASLCTCWVSCRQAYRQLLFGIVCLKMS